MAKAPIQIYIRKSVDRCQLGGGFACELRKVDHPAWKDGYAHDFVGGTTDFVYPTDAERRKIYEQLKEEFDG